MNQFICVKQCGEYGVEMRINVVHIAHITRSQHGSVITFGVMMSDNDPAWVEVMQTPTEIMEMLSK